MARKRANSDASKHIRRKPAAAGRPARRAAPKKKAARKTKRQVCLELLERPEGATLTELSKATGWQPHSVRGFLSGTVRKIPGVRLTTDAEPGQPRRYRIEKSADEVRP